MRECIKVKRKPKIKKNEVDRKIKKIREGKFLQKNFAEGLENKNKKFRGAGK